MSLRRISPFTSIFSLHCSLFLFGIFRFNFFMQTRWNNQVAMHCGTSSGLCPGMPFFHEELHSRVKPAKNNVSAWNIYLPRTQRCRYIGLGKNTSRRRWRNNILPFCWNPRQKICHYCFYTLSQPIILYEDFAVFARVNHIHRWQ